MSLTATNDSDTGDRKDIEWKRTVVFKTVTGLDLKALFRFVYKTSTNSYVMVGIRIKLDFGS